MASLARQAARRPPSAAELLLEGHVDDMWGTSTAGLAVAVATAEVTVLGYDRPLDAKAALAGAPFRVAYVRCVDQFLRESPAYTAALTRVGPLAIWPATFASWLCRWAAARHRWRVAAPAAWWVMRTFTGVIHPPQPPAR